MTVGLASEFAKPVPPDQELTIAGEPTRSRSPICEAQGQIRLPDGTELATGTGFYVRLLYELIEQTNSELDSWEVVPDWSDDIALLLSHAM